VKIEVYLQSTADFNPQRGLFINLSPLDVLPLTTAHALKPDVDEL